MIAIKNDTIIRTVIKVIVQKLYRFFKHDQFQNKLLENQHFQMEISSFFLKKERKKQNLK